MFTKPKPEIHRKWLMEQETSGWRRRNFSLERVVRDAKESKHLALQIGQLQLEDLGGAPVLEQMVALG
jgi:hypothetical protein